MDLVAFDKAFYFVVFGGFLRVFFPQALSLMLFDFKDWLTFCVDFVCLTSSHIDHWHPVIPYVRSTVVGRNIPCEVLLTI